MASIVHPSCAFKTTPDPTETPESTAAHKSARPPVLTVESTDRLAPIDPQTGLKIVPREKTLIFVTPMSESNVNVPYIGTQTGNTFLKESLYYHLPLNEKEPLVPWLADGMFE